MKSFHIKIIVLSVLMIIGMMWTSWGQTTTITITAAPGGTETHYICEQQYNQVILYKPSWALNGVHFFSNDGYGDFFQDSIIITNANDGLWYLMSFEGNVAINIYLISGPPSEPWTFTTLSTCGILHSQINPKLGTTYLWNTGATTESIITTVISEFPVTYMVTVTNACGVVTDQVTINWAGPLPDLGSDTTVCYYTDLYPGNFTAYQWTGGSTQPTLNVTTSGTYSVTVTNGGTCRTTDEVNITVDTAISMEMCYVSFDTATWKNRIDWFVDPGQTHIDSVNVVVKNQLGQWVDIGAVEYTDGSLIDWGSSPQADYNEYRVYSIGACGWGNASQTHRSIWLTELSNELQWQNYYGPVTPPYYVVFALMVGGAIVPIDTIPACSGAGCLNHSPIVSNPSIIKYFVAYEGSCTSNKDAEWVLSNYWDPFAGTAEVPEKGSVLLFPNPTTGIINIAGTDGENQVEVYDLFGRCILHTENASTIDLEKFSSGTYFMKVSTATGVFASKVVKQ